MGSSTNLKGFMREGKSVGGSSSSPDLGALVPSNLNEDASVSVNAINSLSVILHSVLHHVCAFYENDPRRRERMFRELLRHLPVVPSAVNLYDVPEYASLRQHYQNQVVRMLRLSQGSLDDPDAADVPPALPFSLDSDYLAAEGLFQSSRYENEYEELEFLARGGFGAVYRAKNKLDGCEYAVKKILLKCRDLDMFGKILREVTTLASLSHANVVCYKTAWLEPDLKGKNGNRLEHSESISGSSSSFSSSWSPNRDGIFVESPSSSGVVFTEDSQASDHRKGEPYHGKSSAISVPLPMSQNVLSIIDLEEVDGSYDDDLPHVTGKAATPPAASGFAKAKKFWSKSSRTRTTKTKFILGDDDDSEGGGGDCILETKESSKLVVENRGLAAYGGGASEIALSALNGRRNSQYMKYSAENVDRAVLYLQMQLCQSTLRHWMDQREIVKEEENERVFQQILEGVQYIHSKNIIHRDLKPKNIFLGKNQEVLIGDFGLAKHEEFVSFPSEDGCEDVMQNGHEPIKRLNSLHTSGVGTQAYAAPEQLESGIADEKSDMYSLGIILYELYQPPFGTEMERRRAISDLRQGRDSLVFIDEHLAEMIRRLVDPDPAMRPGASELLQSIFSNGETRSRRLEGEVRRLRELLQKQEKVIEDKDREIERLKRLIPTDI